MIYLQLFLSFVKIGFTSFGGLSMVPLISQEMIRYGFMTASEVTDIVAIAEMTPGPLGINCATFAGVRSAGVAGAVAANLGVMMPSLTLCMIAAAFFERFKENRILRHMLLGIRPACIGMIAGVVLKLSMTNYAPDGAVSPLCLVLGFISAVLMFSKKFSIPFVITLNAAAGIVCFGFLGLH